MKVLPEIRVRISRSVWSFYLLIFPTGWRFLNMIYQPNIVM